METLVGLDCFVRSAEAGSFAEAARRIGITPAAVGKNVAKLEASVGVRLFQRSTRSLTLTEAGERFLLEVRGGLSSIQHAVANLASSAGQPGSRREHSRSAWALPLVAIMSCRCWIHFCSATRR